MNGNTKGALSMAKSLDKVNLAYLCWKECICTGICEWISGHRYEGEWLHDLRHGKGRQTFRDALVYDGDWRKDNKHGKGEYILLRLSLGGVLLVKGCKSRLLEIDILVPSLTIEWKVKV